MSWITIERPWLLALLLLLPLIVRLHVRRARSLASDRIDVWERALARAGALRRRRLPLRLLLALLAWTAFVCAAAGLQRPAAEGYRHVFFVVDGSPSMATRDAAGEERRAAARAMIAGLGAPHWIDVRSWTITGNALVDSVTASTESARLDLAAALAMRVAPDGCVVLISDGAGPSPWPSSVPDNLRLRSVGDPATANAGIVRAELTDPWPGPELTLRLWVSAPSGATLAIEGAGGASVLEVAGGSPAEVTLPRGAGGPVVVRLRDGDAFALDDAIEIDVRPPWSPQLLALPRESPALRPVVEFLRRSLAADVVAAKDDLAEGSDVLLIVDGGRLPEWPKDGACRVLFGTALPGLDSRVAFERFPDWDRSDRLLAGLDLSALRGERRVRKTGALPDGVRVLAWVGDDPFVVTSAEHRLLWFATAATASNLTVQPFLPILVLRALPRLVPADGDSRVQGLLDPAESDVAARAPPPSRKDVPLYRPPVPYWPWLLALAIVLVWVRELVREDGVRRTVPGTQPRKRRTRCCGAA